MKFVICYEDQTIPALVEGNQIAAADRVSHAVKEIDWLGKYWFKSGSYVKLDGKPVLLSFGHNGLTKTEWSECLTQISTPVSYFSQDIRREGAIGGFGWPSPKLGLKRVDDFIASSRSWPHAIPAAYPRFDDVYREAGVGEGYPQLDDNDGQTFRESLRKALESEARIIQIATWNDWGEGTQIEPSREFRYRDLEMVQSMLRSRFQRPLARENLELPRRLYEARLNSTQQDIGDSVADLIVSGKTDEARSLLENASRP